MYKELMGYVKKIKNQYLRQLVEYYFVKDEKFVKKFKAHSAAKSVHHGFSGGHGPGVFGCASCSPRSPLFRMGQSEGKRYFSYHWCSAVFPGGSWLDDAKWKLCKPLAGLAGSGGAALPASDSEDFARYFRGHL